MRRKHLVLLGFALSLACLCFLLSQPSPPEAQAPPNGSTREVLEATPSVELPRALHARVDSTPTEKTNVEITEVASAPPTTTILEPPSLPKSARALIAGTVVVPREWELRNFSLQIDDPKSRTFWRAIESNEMQAVSGRADTFSWSLPGATAGRYRVGVLPTLFTVELDVGPEGRQDIEIDVPPPSSVEVHVVDALSKAPSRLAWLDWWVLMNSHDVEQVVTTQDPFEQMMQQCGWGSSKENDMKTGVFRFNAPQGSSLRLGTRSNGTLRTTDTFRELQPGRNEFELFTSDAGGFVLRAKDGEEFINWPPDCTVEAEAIDGAGTVQVWDDDGARGHRAFVSLPGRYHCRLSKIKGFALLDPFEVEVLEGKFKQVTVELRREF